MLSAHVSILVREGAWKVHHSSMLLIRKTSFKLLGINFDVDLDKIVNINYNERILQIKKNN
jgi:hypothetical protein